VTAERVDSAEQVEPVLYVDADSVVAPDALGANLAAKIDAGAALVYALYHSGGDFVKDMPLPLMRAYMKACKAYGVGR
jgi:hypothetical protein